MIFFSRNVVNTSMYHNHRKSTLQEFAKELAVNCVGFLSLGRFTGLMIEKGCKQLQEALRSQVNKAGGLKPLPVGLIFHSKE